MQILRPSSWFSNALLVYIFQIGQIACKPGRAKSSVDCCTFTGIVFEQLLTEKSACKRKEKMNTLTVSKSVKQGHAGSKHVRQAGIPSLTSYQTSAEKLTGSCRMRFLTIWSTGAFESSDNPDQSEYPTLSECHSEVRARLP